MVPMPLLDMRWTSQYPYIKWVVATMCTVKNV